MDTFPESDRLLDFPHPRETAQLYGHENAETQLLRNYLSGKMHHAWVLGGPRGIGKATLAYRAARFVLRHADAARLDGEPQSLSISPDEPVFRRVAGGGHGDLFAARREYDPNSKRLRRDIGIGDIRKAARFFSHTSGAGGWRICIVDTADDLNRASANALLKILEEPPDRSLFLLVAHSPARLPATLLSRCIRLNLQALAEPAFAQTLAQHLKPGELPDRDDIKTLHTATAGSPGRAMSMLRGGGWETFVTFQDLLRASGKAARKQELSFAETLGARGTEENYAAFCELMLQWLADQARNATLAQTPAGTRLATGLSADARQLAGLWQDIAHSIDRANALNLDRKQTLLQTLRMLRGQAA